MKPTFSVYGTLEASVQNGRYLQFSNVYILPQYLAFSITN
jgi:hypothetical protein